MKYHKSNLDFVKASLTEFLKIWAVGGRSVLVLESFGGHANLSLKANLGPPGGACYRAPNGGLASQSRQHCDERPSSVHVVERRKRPRHRGPAAK